MNKNQRFVVWTIADPIILRYVLAGTIPFSNFYSIALSVTFVFVCVHMYMQLHWKKLDEIVWLIKVAHSKHFLNGMKTKKT